MELDGPAPVIRVGRYSGTSTDYVELCRWTVGKIWGGRSGELRAIRVFASDYTSPRFRIEVKKMTLVDEQKLDDDLVLNFPSNDVLRANDEVVVWARSSDGTSITCQASITGVERP